MVDIEKVVDQEHVQFSLNEEFARSYYRDEIKAKGLNPDFHVAINGNYDKRSPSYYTMESQVNKFTGHETSSNDNKTELSLRDEWEKDFQLTTIGTVIVIVECLQLTKKHLRCLRCIIL